MTDKRLNDWIIHNRSRLLQIQDFKLISIEANLSLKIPIEDIECMLHPKTCSCYLVSHIKK